MDKDIRKVLYSHIFDHHSGVIIDELGLNRIIADLAVLNGDSMAGYEIKSDGDTLARLPLQSSMYSKVFSFSYLVATNKHIDKALDIIPSHWGVIRAEVPEEETASLEDTDTVDASTLPMPMQNSSQPVDLTVVREAERSTDIKKLFIARLLWKEELLSALEHLRADKGVRSKNKITMQKRLISHVSIEDLQAIVCQYMLARTGWKVFRTQ